MIKKLLVILLFLSINLSADRGIQQLQEMKEEQRVALVIGNSNYKNLAKLKNPINDARLMKSVLKNRGFEVIYKENATKQDMKKLVKKFSYKLSRGGIGLYYFAGHGVNVDGKNYLVGTNSVMDDKDEVEYETLALNFVTKKMKSAGNRLNIIILDACRNNPFHRGSGGGLAPVSNAKGIFIAYATEAGSVASDGRDGKNGVFTRYLVKNLQESGATIETVFKNTRADVFDATNGEQSPGVYNQIRGDFFFTLPTGNTTLVIPSETKNTSPKKQSKSSFKNEAPTTFTLTINPSPSTAKVSITNIKPKYYDGIRLKKGSYNIKVSKSGYITKKGKVDLESDFSADIVLEKIKTVYKKLSYKTSSNKNITIINGLMWQDEKYTQKEYTALYNYNYGKVQDWQGAKNYCRDLNLAGYRDWRLPNKEELKNLYKKKDKLKNSNSKRCWSSHTYADGSIDAWSIGFHNGSIYYGNKNYNYFIRCIRSTK